MVKRVESFTLRTVTVLFTDIVDSTASRRRLGDARAEQLRTVVDATQHDAIERNGGRVVKSTGDGVMAVFQSAGQALAAGVELQAGVRAAMRGVDTDVELRVGMSAGDVSRDDSGDFFGLPVVEAARLCDTAAGGQVLVADVVRVLAGSWSDLDLADRGQVELKGLDAVRHWEVEWIGAPDPIGSGVGILVDEEFPFVGRGAELNQLVEIFDRVVDGTRAGALVEGEAGLGKTRLAIEAARRLRLRGAMILSGRCEQGATAPLLPFEAASVILLKAWGRDWFREAAGPFLGELLRHYPNLSSSLGPAPEPADPDPEVERWRLVSGLTRLLRQAALRQPVVLVIDDAQWADPASLSYIQRLLRTENLGPVYLLMTLRDTPDELTPDFEEFLTQVHVLPWVERIHMDGLGADELESLIEQTHIEANAGAIWDETRGHPFFAAEMIRFARDFGLDHSGVPRSIRDLLSGRIRRLSTDAVEILTIGAAAGSEFDLATVAEIAGLGELQAVTAAEEAIAARLLVEVPEGFDRYQFPHRLITDALGDMTSSSRRARIHRAFAAALEETGGRTSDVARHLQSAVPLVSVSEAVEATKRAADEAIERGSPDEAASLFEGALRLDVDADTEVELELAVGQACNFAGKAASGVPWFERAARGAITIDRFDVLVEAALGCWAGNPWIENADRRAPELLQLALDHCPDDDAVSRARIEAGLAAFSIFSASLERRNRVTADAVEVVRRTGDVTLLASTLASRFTAIASPLAVDELEQIDRELAELEADADFETSLIQEVPVASAPGFVGVSTAECWRGDGDAYRAAVASFDLEDPRTPDWVATVAFQLRAVVGIFDGDLTRAEADADRAVEIGGWGDASRGNHMWQRLAIDWLRGDVAPSRGRVADLYDRFGGQPMRATHAWVEAACGDRETSTALLERVRKERLARLPELFLGTLGLAGVAMAVLHLRDRDWARAVIDAFSPVMDLVCGVPWAPYPCGHFFIGLMHLILGDDRAATNSFRSAQPVHDRLGAVSFTAMTDAALARSLREIDAVAAARAHAKAEFAAREYELPGVLTLIDRE